MLLGTLLENLVSGKGMWTAGYGSKKKSDSTHPSTNFEIYKYYQNESRFNRVFSRDNLPNKIKKRSLCNKPWWICRMLEHIGLLYFVLKLKLFTLTTLEWNTFLKKLKNSLEIKT